MATIGTRSRGRARSALAAACAVTVLASSACRADPEPPPSSSTAPAGTTDGTAAHGPGSGARPLTWVALGDSYSAGVGGVAGGDGTGCENRSMGESFSTVTPLKFLTEQSPPIGELRVLACGGATVELADAARPAGDDKTPVGATNTVRYNQLGYLDDADVITLTAGGNDADFASFAVDCLLPKGLGDIVHRGGSAVSMLSSAAKYFADVHPLEKIRSDLADHPCPEHDSTDADLDSVRAGPGEGSDWQALRTRLVALYSLIADRAPDARVYVMKYPIPFASPVDWDGVFGNAGAAADLVSVLARTSIPFALNPSLLHQGEDDVERLLASSICAAFAAPGGLHDLLLDRVFLINAFATRLDDEIDAAVDEVNQRSRDAGRPANFQDVDWTSSGSSRQQVWIDDQHGSPHVVTGLPDPSLPRDVDAARAANGGLHRVAFDSKGMCTSGELQTHLAVIWSMGDSGHPTPTGYATAVDDLYRAVRADVPKDSGTTSARPPALPVAWFTAEVGPTWADRDRWQPPRCRLQPGLPGPPGPADARCVLPKDPRLELG